MSINPLDLTFSGISLKTGKSRRGCFAVETFAQAPRVVILAKLVLAKAGNGNPEPNYGYFLGQECEIYDPLALSWSSMSRK
jgi:hypothetical protein